MDVFLDISNTIIFDDAATKNYTNIATNSSKKWILWLNVRNWWLKKNVKSILLVSLRYYNICINIWIVLYF